MPTRTARPQAQARHTHTRGQAGHLEGQVAGAHAQGGGAGSAPVGRAEVQTGLQGSQVLATPRPVLASSCWAMPSHGQAVCAGRHPISLPCWCLEMHHYPRAMFSNARPPRRARTWACLTRTRSPQTRECCCWWGWCGQWLGGSMHLCAVDGQGHTQAHTLNRRRYAKMRVLSPNERVITEVGAALCHCSPAARLML